jgi:hypothetical protein
MPLRDQPADERQVQAGDATCRTGVLAEPEDDVAARVERECAEQGIPVAIDDPWLPQMRWRSRVRNVALTCGNV